MIRVAEYVCAAALLAAVASAQTVADLDRKAVEEVCGRCHTTDVFQNKPRSWPRWNDVFADMTQRGATGSDEQLTRVTRYFLENLTFVNVNSSPSEELIWVLGVPENVAGAIMERRQQKPFRDLADLSAFPGVDAAKLNGRKSRILF